MEAKDLKFVVKEKYGKIASQSKLLENSCCGDVACCSTPDYSTFNDDYTNVRGYNADADLNLGCGLPTQYAGIEPGDSVLDLGSGAGNDCFVARSIVGESGKVTGLDFTNEMLVKANRNLVKTGFKNVGFVKGDIEEMPLPNDNYDVIISNCVLNLVPDKQKAFSEIYRVLKPEGHFCISDVVIQGTLPAGLKDAAEMYAGCVSGAISKDNYLSIVKESGFRDVILHKEKRITIPDAILLNFLSENELDEFKKSGTGIWSITITASK